MNPSADNDHFSLFGLPQMFAIDVAHLDLRYRKLQSEVHPDRFASASTLERLQSLQAATHANEAYQTLKDPLSRARYLLSLRGIDTQEENNTAMPTEFLMQQMEWREAVEEAQGAHDSDALETLLRKLQHETATLQETLRANMDEIRDDAQAAQTVRKLRFLAKVRDEIERAIEALED
jgi:molecular chaperone HscB